MHYISFPNSLGGDTLVKNGEGVRRGGGGGGGGGFWKKKKKKG